jgi:hypothetical protein
MEGSIAGNYCHGSTELAEVRSGGTQRCLAALGQQPKENKQE